NGHCVRTFQGDGQMVAETSTFQLKGHDVSLAPAEIERELASMWKPADEAGEGSSVSRVVLGNVIWFGPSERLAHARSVIARVVPRYPSRVFLIEFGEARQDEEVHASVNAQCFRPADGGTPVCCEYIHFRIGPRSVHHVPG